METLTQNGLAITPNSLIEKAIENGAGLEQLEKLMDLQERYEKRQAEKAFNKAMAAFQSEKPEIIKTKKGHNSSYAPLPKVQKAIDPVASKYGLSYRFEQRMNNDKMVVTCIVTHEDGHSETCEMEAPADSSGSKNAIQSWGSTRTYLYRYTLEGAFGISSDEDDDGAKTTLSKAELIDRQKTELVELRMEKENKLTENDKKRLDEIIKNEESASYAKAIKLLKTKK